MCVPGRNLPVLMRVSVDRELDQVAPDAAEVEQRVRLARSAVADDALAVALQTDQELEQAPLHLVHTGRKAPVRLELRVSRAPLALEQLADAGPALVASCRSRA